MSGPEFHQTRMGVRFFEADVPRLIRVLERIAVALEAMNPREREQPQEGQVEPPAPQSGA